MMIRSASEPVAVPLRSTEEEEEETRDQTRRMFSKTRDMVIPKPVMRCRGVGPKDQLTGAPLTLRSVSSSYNLI